MNYRDLKTITKHVLSVANAAVATAMYMHGAPVASVLTGFQVFSGSCKLYSDLMAASTQVFNQIIERREDSIMQRTMDRPIPQGKISLPEAVALGAGLTGSGLMILSQINTLAPIVGAVTWASYLGLYVPLKKRTRFNTHIGAVVGALPVYLGWVAGTGTLYGLPPLIMGAFIASWQFPHFYGILWLNRADFIKAGYQMIVNQDETGRKTVLGAKIGAFGMAASAIGLAYIGTVPFWMVGGSIFYTRKRVWDAIKQFEAVIYNQYPNDHTGKHMMISSYHIMRFMFLTLFGGYFWKEIYEYVDRHVKYTREHARKYQEHRVSDQARVLQQSGF